MRITSSLIEAVRAIPEITPTQQYVYLAAAHYQPETITHLASLTGFSRSTVRVCCGSLQTLGLVHIEEEKGRLHPLVLIPEACQEDMVSMLKVGYEAAAWRGEYLMRRYLDLIVNDYDYIENARPGLLVNPFTGKPLEYDRYYRKRGASFEYDGAQHKQTTSRFNTTQEALLSQRQRDLLKEALSKEAKITLTRVTGADLSTGRMMALITGLPRNHVDVDSFYCRTLDALSREYANNPDETSERW